jgi:hypothetical protein
MKIPTEFIMANLQLDIYQTMEQGILRYKPLDKSCLNFIFGGEVFKTLAMVFF